jgi:hypothetical protein
MAEKTATGDRTIHIGPMEAWANENGVFLSSKDPDAEFITELHGDAAAEVMKALRHHGRETGKEGPK